MTGTKKPATPPATRQRILKVATEEFANRGFAGARIETIMRRSKVSKNLIYHYFKSKEQLFQSVLEADYEKIRFDRVAWPVDGRDPVGNICDLVGLIFEHWRSSNQFIKLLASENFSKGKHIRKLDRIKTEYARRIERIEAVLAEGVRRGQIRPGIDAAELYVSISALVYHRISNRYTLSFLLDRSYEDSASLDACLRHEPGSRGGCDPTSPARFRQRGRGRRAVPRNTRGGGWGFPFPVTPQPPPPERPAVAPIQSRAIQ